MSKRPRVRDRSTTPTLQLGIAFPNKERILDPKTRDEIVALLGRLLLDATRREKASEVHDDAS
jgi:hypothetical protein